MVSRLLLLAALLMAWPPASPAQSTMPTEHSADIAARARALLSALAGGHFDVAEHDFTAQVRAALPPERLADVWHQIITQAGSLKQVDGERIVEQPPFRVVVLATAFERAELDVVVAFDTSAQIAGLHFTPHAGAAPSDAAPPPYADTSTFREEQVTVGNGEWALPGTLSRPTAPGSVPAVVLVHGSGPNDRDETIGGSKPFRDLAWGLASRGIAVLRYDKRTLVHASALASAPTLTVQEETIDDAIAAVSLLGHTAGIDPNRIVVLGHSLGGMLVPRIGVQDQQIAGFIIMAGATRPLQDLMLEQVAYIDSVHGDTSLAAQHRLAELRHQIARIDALTPGAAPSSTGAILGAPASYWLDLRGYHPADVATHVHRPMLILQGGRDYQVTAADYAAWQRTLGGRSDVQFHLYPSLNHLFIEGTGPSRPEEYAQPGHVAREVVDDIASWIRGLGR